MKRMKSLLLFVVACMFAGCEQQPSTLSDGSVTIDSCGLVSCDFDMVKDTITIPLSEWVDEFRIVRFENKDTADRSLFDRLFNIGA